MEYPMERTFSLEARAVVPTTLGLTSEVPSAGNRSTMATNSHKGMAFRMGLSHGAPIEPRRKYAQLRMSEASERALLKPNQSAPVQPKMARNQTAPPNIPASVPV